MKALKRNSDNLILACATEIDEHTTVAPDTGNTIPCYHIVGDPEDSVKDYHLSKESGTFTIVDLASESNVPVDIAKHSKYFFDGSSFALNPDYKGS